MKRSGKSFAIVQTFRNDVLRTEFGFETEFGDIFTDCADRADPLNSFIIAVFSERCAAKSIFTDFDVLRQPYGGQ